MALMLGSIDEKIKHELVMGLYRSLSHSMQLPFEGGLKTEDTPTYLEFGVCKVMQDHFKPCPAPRSMPR